jgi:hypothetical protein
VYRYPPSDSVNSPDRTGWFGSGSFGRLCHSVALLPGRAGAGGAKQYAENQKEHDTSFHIPPLMGFSFILIVA